MTRGAEADHHSPRALLRLPHSNYVSGARVLHIFLFHSDGTSDGGIKRKEYGSSIRFKQNSFVLSEPSASDAYVGLLDRHYNRAPVV